MNRPITIVLIDDHPAASTGVVALIRSQPDFRVLAALAEVEIALQKVQETKPNIVLLNLRQEGDDGLTLAGALHGEVPDSKVIMMGLTPQEQDLASLVRAGIAGFVLAGASFDDFVHTIHTVAAGNQVLPVALTGSLFRQLSEHGLRDRPRRVLDIERLTLRERQVANLITQGCSNKEIATQLHITVHTVKCHVHNVLAKLAVNSRLEIAALSHRAPDHQLTPARPVTGRPSGASDFLMLGT